MNLDEIEAEIDQSYREGKIDVSQLVDLTVRLADMRRAEPRSSWLRARITLHPMP